MLCREQGMEFYLEMEPPTVTAQEHKVVVRHGKPMFYDTERLKAARATFLNALRPYAPEVPLEGPVSLAVSWNFATKSHAHGSWRITRPDTDNLQKLLKDCMTAAGFWKDDAQVCLETVSKQWNRIRPGIDVSILPLGESRDSTRRSSMRCFLTSRKRL